MDRVKYACSTCGTEVTVRHADAFPSACANCGGSSWRSPLNATARTISFGVDFGLMKPAIRFASPIQAESTH